MRISRLLFAMVVALVMAAAPAFAQGKGHGHGKPGNAADTPSNSQASNASQHKDKDDDEAEGGHHGPPSRPPGWDKGEKKGWNGGSVPPGLAKHGDENQQSLGDVARQYRQDKAKQDAARNASGTSETHTSNAGSGTGRTPVSGHRPPIQRDSQSKTATPADKKQK